MLDTITLSLATPQAEAVTSKLSGAREIVDRGTGEVSWSGSLRNLKVRVWSGRVWLTGSLPKFYFGNNVETLTRKETERAITKLSDALGESLAGANVFRLDIGRTFEVSRPPSDYWRDIVTPARMKRHEYGLESLTLCNRQRAVVFYDKQAETRRAGARPNERAEAKRATGFLSQSNLLRFEVQLKRKLGQALGWQDIRAGTLSNAAFYERAVGEWEALYFRLERGRLVRLPQGENDVKSVMNRFAALGVQEFGGLQRAIDWVETERQAGRIDKGQAFRLRQKLKDLSRLETVTVESDAARELDAKVRQAAAICR
jgi:hypothetical protein